MTIYRGENHFAGCIILYKNQDKQCAFLQPKISNFHFKPPQQLHLEQCDRIHKSLLLPQNMFPCRFHVLSVKTYKSFGAIKLTKNYAH